MIDYIHSNFAWIYGIVNIQKAYGNIIPVFMVLLRMMFQVYCHQIHNTQSMNIIYRKIKYDFYKDYDDDMRPSGLIIHNPFSTNGWFPQYIIYKNEHERVMYVYCTNRYINDRLLCDDNTIIKTTIHTTPIHLHENSSIENESVNMKQKEVQSKQKFLIRSGDSSFIRYRAKNISIPRYVFTPIQGYMYEKVMEHYNENNFSVVFIEGPINTGKTCFAYLLAKELSTTLVDAFNPTEPSDSFENLYTSVEHSPTKPLIILLDEVETILSKVHKGIPIHKNYLIHLRNKTQWNSFLDRIQLGCFPNVILIMCSNISRKYINKSMDPSYLRDGRVNLLFKSDAQLF